MSSMWVRNGLVVAAVVSVLSADSSSAGVDRNRAMYGEVPEVAAAANCEVCLQQDGMAWSGDKCVADCLPDLPCFTVLCPDEVTEATTLTPVADTPDTEEPSCDPETAAPVTDAATLPPAAATVTPVADTPETEEPSCDPETAAPVTDAATLPPAAAPVTEAATLEPETKVPRDAGVRYTMQATPTDESFDVTPTDESFDATQVPATEFFIMEPEAPVADPFAVLPDAEIQDTFVLMPEETMSPVEPTPESLVTITPTPDVFSDLLNDDESAEETADVEECSDSPVVGDLVDMFMHYEEHSAAPDVEEIPRRSGSKYATHDAEPSKEQSEIDMILVMVESGDYDGTIEFLQQKSEELGMPADDIDCSQMTDDEKISVIDKLFDGCYESKPSETTEPIVVSGELKDCLEMVQQGNLDGAIESLVATALARDLPCPKLDLQTMTVSEKIDATNSLLDLVYGAGTSTSPAVKDISTNLYDVIPSDNNATGKASGNVSGDIAFRTDRSSTPSSVSRSLPGLVSVAVVVVASVLAALL